MDNWLEHSRWPKRHFVADDQAVQSIQDYGKTSLDEYFEREFAQEEMESPPHKFLARKRSVSSRSQTETPTEQKRRGANSIPYLNLRYPSLLVTKGIFLDISEIKITESSRIVCEELMSNPQTPQQSLLDESTFDDICNMFSARNEARVIRDISPLIVPSAGILELKRPLCERIFVESLSEGWDNCITITEPRPQPDYSVGF